jgi:hypothetical protein
MPNVVLDTRSTWVPVVDAMATGGISGFHLTYLCIGLMSMLAALIFAQLARKESRE